MEDAKKARQERRDLLSKKKQTGGESKGEEEKKEPSTEEKNGESKGEEEKKETTTVEPTKKRRVIRNRLAASRRKIKRLQKIDTSMLTRAAMKRIIAWALRQPQDTLDTKDYRMGKNMVTALQDWVDMSLTVICQKALRRRLENGGRKLTADNLDGAYEDWAESMNPAFHVTVEIDPKTYTRTVKYPVSSDEVVTPES